MKLTLTKNLDALRADALDRIDRAAAAERLALTPEPSIAPVWAAKAQAARAWLAQGGDPPRPFAAEIGITGPDAAAVARAILAKAEPYQAALDAIEARRIAAKAAVRAAATVAEIEAAGVA